MFSFFYCVLRPRVVRAGLLVERLLSYDVVTEWGGAAVFDFLAMLLRHVVLSAEQVSTRILGRRAAPFPPFLVPNRAPHGVTPRS